MSVCFVCSYLSMKVSEGMKSYKSRLRNELECLWNQVKIVIWEGPLFSKRMSLQKTNVGTSQICELITQDLRWGRSRREKSNLPYLSSGYLTTTSPQVQIETHNREGEMEWDMRYEEKRHGEWTIDRKGNIYTRRLSPDRCHISGCLVLFQNTRLANVKVLTTWEWVK